MTAPLLVYGGTFDPVHQGHYQVARTALEALAAERALLLPCGDPPHRGAPKVNAEHRAEMLQRAFADDPRFQVDRRELRRQGPSYSVLSLRELRAEQGAEQPIVLLLGDDAAQGLGSWHEARALSGLVHLLVVARPGHSVDPALLSGLGWRPASTARQLGESPYGQYWRIDVPLSAASSTAVRAAGNSARPDLPAAVADYIDQHGLYR